MKAVAVFPRQHKLELIEHPAPAELAEGQVHIQVLEVGICGTDREIATYEYGVPPEGSQYLILGHESLGQVVETARGVTNLREGDLVVPTVRRRCAELCEACKAGRQDFCYTGHYRERGILGEHGFLTERIVEEDVNLNVVPPSLRDVGILAEPLTVTEKAFDQIVATQRRLPWTLHRDSTAGPPGRALILGAGPVGLLAAMKFKAEGFEVHVYSRGSEREKPPIVAEMEAHFIDAEVVPPSELHSIAPIDVVYEAMGAADISFAVLDQLGRNGVFVFTGIPRRSHPVNVDTSALLYNLVLKNQVILGTVNAAPSHFQTAIADLARFRERFPTALRQLITNRFPMDQFQEPLFHARGIKNVIAIDPTGTAAAAV